MVALVDDLQSGWTNRRPRVDVIGTYTFGIGGVRCRFIDAVDPFFPFFFLLFMQYLARRNINLGAASLVRDIDATRRACRLCIFIDR